MPLKKGAKKHPASGRKRGTVNKFTGTVKEHVLQVFRELQEDEAEASLKVWAEKQPGEFYKIAAKLIPTEVNATISEVKISVNRKINPE
jgi:hypothetical protein